MGIMVGMRDQIVQALGEIERQYGVHVLFACESGSRAWGFESPNSDYDVRFLYVRPLADYMKIRPPRDVIEEMLPNDLDVSGWDLRKALHLLKKSNPSLFEWLQSPIVYRRNETFMAEFLPLAEAWYDAATMFRHYLHMAEGNWKAYLQGESVSRKKYLYVLRPTLACQWIEERGGPVPMEFDHLVAKASIRGEVRQAIAGLLAQKKAGDELAEGSPDPVLHSFLEAELSRLDGLINRAGEKPSDADLDALFLRWVLSSGGPK